ncbi:MAG: 16S rRNA (cytosine(967)-C(5))-methyltransferase RsmB [Candidatus Kapaibacterium sp.]
MEKVTISENNNIGNLTTVTKCRVIATHILNRYDRSDSYIDKLLESELRSNDLNRKDKALLTQLVNGTVRWRAKLDWVLIGFFHGEFHKSMNIVKNAMRIALYQILFMEKIPEHAAINESVELVKQIQGQKAASLVNGVLRNIVRNKQNIRFPDENEDRIFYLSIVHSHPKWMTKRWVNFWGEDFAVKLMEANNRIPYLAMRVNKLKSNAEEVENLLNKSEIKFEKSIFHPDTYKVKNLGNSITMTELYKRGMIAVQDPSASLAAELTNAKPGMKVIDLCAAPGGKSFKIAEMMENKGKLVSNDKYWGKLKILSSEAERLGISIIEQQKEDASECNAEEKADVVIIDAPCSGSGTFSKKPDIKWKREIEDVYKLNTIQKDILKNAPNLIKENGAIVYSTCSIEPEENMGIIEWFLNKFPEFTIDPAENYLPKEVCKDGFMQTFPNVHHTDGAFAARLIRKK